MSPKPILNATSDGRSLRAERNRSLIAETFLDLLEQGEVQPTAQMVSDQSGVSTSTIFRLYEDLDVLRKTVALTQFERVRSLLVDISSDQTLSCRIEELVTMRAVFYEKVASVRRFTLALRPRPPFVDEVYGINEKVFHAQTKKLFAEELATLSGGKLVLATIDTLTSWEAWDRMRVTQKMSSKRAQDALKMALRKLLSE